MTAYLVLGFFALVYLLSTIHRKASRRDVSSEWLADNNRREWGAGVDLPCIKFPIQRS